MDRRARWFGQDVAVLESNELGNDYVPMWQLAATALACVASAQRGAKADVERFTAKLTEMAATGAPLEVSAYHVTRAHCAAAAGEFKQALTHIELSVDLDRSVGFAYGLGVDSQSAAYFHFKVGDEAGGREALALGVLLGEIGALGAEAPGDGARVERHSALCDRLESLYRGPFVDDDTANALREYGERVRGKVAVALRTLASRLTQLGAAPRARTLTERLIEADPALAAPE